MSSSHMAGSKELLTTPSETPGVSKARTLPLLCKKGEILKWGQETPKSSELQGETLCFYLQKSH